MPLSFAHITFPSDYLTIGDLRRIDGRFDQNAGESFVLNGAEAAQQSMNYLLYDSPLLLILLERRLVRLSDARASGLIQEADPKNTQLMSEIREVGERLARWYQQVELAPGPAAARALVRSLEDQVRDRRSEGPPL